MNYPKLRDNSDLPCVEKPTDDDIDAVCGGDADLTCETLGEFIAGANDDVAKLLYTLLSDGANDYTLARAAKELRAMYLNDPHVKTVIDNRIDELLLEAA